MKTTSPASHADQVIPVTLTAPNRHTHAMIRVADACPDQDRPIATRITLNTGSAKTRHLAAYRMTRDPAMPLAGVQWVLGHAQLATTQLYMSAPAGEVITGVLAHHARMAAGKERPPGEEPPPGLRYRPESLEVLFGRPRHDHP